MTTDITMEIVFWLVAVVSANWALGLVKALLNRDQYYTDAAIHGVQGSITQLIIVKTIQLGACGTALYWLGNDLGYFQVDSTLTFHEALGVIFALYVLSRLYRFFRRAQTRDTPSSQASSSFKSTPSVLPSRGDAISNAKQYGGENAATLVEYSDDVFHAYQKIEALGDEYKMRFYEHLETDGADKILDFASKLMIEQIKESEGAKSPITIEEQHSDTIKRMSDLRQGLNDMKKRSS